MAIAVQQIDPIAHFPLVLGVLRRLEVATVIDASFRPTLRMSWRLGGGSKPWSWRFWTVIMPSIR